MFSNIEYYISKLIKKLHLKSIKNSQIDKRAGVCAGTLIVNSKLGKYSDVGYDCVIINTEIGNFCSLGSNIKIGGASHPIYWGSTSTVFCKYKDHIKKKFGNHDYNPSEHTVIGSDVWIADNVMIKSGVNIGNGAVIGMGAIVTKDVGSYEIWAGNPAVCIKKRFDTDTIDQLEKTYWWERDDDYIQEIGEYVNDINLFLKKINEEKF